MSKDYPIEYGTFEYVDSIACGFCPICGEQGDFTEEKLPNDPDCEFRLVVKCDNGHESEVYFTRHGDVAF